MATMFFDAYTRIGPRPKDHGSHPWTLRHLLDELDHCSISGALVASTGQTQYDAMWENRRLTVQLAGKDHLFPIWNVLPHWSGECPEPEQLTRELDEHGVRAVSINPKTNGWDVRSRTSRPLLAELERTQTLTITSWASEIEPRDVEYLVSEYPRLPLLVRGVWWSQGRALLPLVLAYRNLHLGFDHFQVNRAPEWLVAKGCEDQMVFCSNAPQMSAGAHRAYIDWAELDPAVKAKIAGGNLVRLLKGLRPRSERVNGSEDELMAATRRGEPLPCLTLDMHAHILDEGLQGGGGSYVMFDGGPRGVHHQARRMGVDGIGLMSWSGTVGAHAAEGNASVKAALDAFPDFYWGLATFDVMHESAESMRRQMDEIYADPRFLGLKPYPQYGIAYDDPRYNCWWEFGNQRHLYTGFHPVKWFKPDEFDSVCSRFPNLTVVAYHCGASYAVADTAIELAKKHRNFLIEPTLTPVCGGIIDYLVKGAGVDRVVYGSDLPMRDPRQQLGWIVFSRLSVEEKKQVLGLNARRLIDGVRAHQREAAAAKS
jgi:predicted TIM-barrel fold metal-dependent hydrolase